MTTSYRMDLLSYRGRALLQEAISKYDAPPPPYGSFWLILTAALLAFTLGGALGGILQTSYPEDNVILGFVAFAAIAMVLVCSGLGFYLEAVGERKKKLTETLESYMDAQHDCAKYANREAH